jgi:hypothetical protein
MKPFRQQFVVPAERVPEQPDVFVDHLVVGADFDGHGIALQADAVNDRIGRVVELPIPVGLGKVLFCPTDEDGQIEDACIGSSFRLAGPLFRR